MKAYEAVEEKKRKRAMAGPTGGSSSSAPLKYRMVYTPPAVQPRRPPQFWGNHLQFQLQQPQYNRTPFTP
jgi:hypothetical protein